jgi:CMP/dCMP kinase
MEPQLVIAIDGVVGAGKTTTAKKVAAALGYRHIDTGAMYRAVTLAATRRGIVADDAEALESLVAGLSIDLTPQGCVLLDGEDVSEAIRRPEISRQVGAYADRPQVRRALVVQQRALGRRGGVVGEGRDVGSVVFPQADLKVLLTAALAERVRRRLAELLAKGVDTDAARVEADILRRDHEDAERDYGAPAPQDQRCLDTTDLSLDQQVERIVEWARRQETAGH